MTSPAWWRRCEVCGFEANEPRVGPSLAKYRGGGYDHVIRCQDADACRARSEAAGQPWPFEPRREPAPYVQRVPEPGMRS